MQILDTDTLSHLFHNHPRVLQRLNDTNDLTVITVVNKIELRNTKDFRKIKNLKLENWMD